MYKKIVTFPGSFNPLSLAHVKAIIAAVDYLSADVGFLIPTSYNYLHNKMNIAGDGFVLSDKIRRDMIDIACMEDSRLVFGGEEEASSSATIARVLRDNPGAKTYYIIGADKIDGLHKWKNIEHLLSATTFVVFERGDQPVAKLIHKNPLLREHPESFIILPELQGCEDISSTKIRELFYAGDKAGYRQLMLPGVADIMDTQNPNNYPPVSFAVQYSAIHNQGSFGRSNAFKFVEEKNREVFPTLSGRDALMANTKVYSKEFNVEDVPGKTSKLTVGCLKSNLPTAAKQLIDSGFNPVIVSTCNRFKACQGYDDGHNLRTEDELCRVSNLSESIFQFGDPKLKAVKDSGVENKYCAFPLDINFGGIYSPGVNFFRNGEKDQYSLLSQQFCCSVVSAAPLTNREKDSGKALMAEHSYFTETKSLTGEGISIMSNKIRTILRIAIANGHDSLVIGDFAVCNELIAAEVADIFENVLKEKEFEGKLSNIIFAFEEGKGNKAHPVEENGKYGAFYQKFGRYSKQQGGC